MRVVTLVAGDVTNDTRVKREALGLARAGLEVTVVSRALGDAGDVRPLGPALVLKVPVPATVRTAVLERRARRRARRPLPGWLADARSRELLARRREARRLADPPSEGPVPLPRRVRDGLARRALQGAESVAEWVDDATARAWEAFDDRFYGSTVGASWRRSLDGLVDDLELGYGPLLDALEPDVIHAHDMHVLGVAVHAARRAAAAGRDVKVVYDAHEYVPGLAVTGAFTRRSVAAWADYEAHYLPAADAVIAVSEGSARAIQQRHGLAERPAVVLNVPVVDELAPPPPPLRELCGIGPDVPLLAYAGIIREVRGIDTSIAALHELPGVHLAVVCVPHSRTKPVLRLAEHVAQQGLADRVHFVDPVDPGQVVPFVASADVGLVPMVGGWLNHELTLPNKLFEYVAAGVPVVASDLTGLGRVVTERGLGRVFTPGDPVSLARAVREVLDDPRARERVRAPDVREDFSWPAQERVLHGVYRRLLGDLPGVPEGSVPLSLRLRPVPADRRPAVAGRTPHVVLGPLNHGHGASRAADALRGLLPDATVEVTMVGRRRSDPAVETAVTRESYRRDLAWSARQLRRLLTAVTHVVVEDGLPLAGTVHGEDGLEQVRMLREAGLAVVVWVRRLDAETLAERLPAWRDAGAAVVVDADLPVADEPVAAGLATVPADGAGSALAQALAGALGLVPASGRRDASAPTAR